MEFWCNAIYNTIYCDKNLIIPRLWLGNIYSAWDSKFINDNEINIIINCTPDLDFITKSVEFDYPIETKRVVVEDSRLEKDFIIMEENLKWLIPYLYSEYLAGKNILVHCYAGKQRSAIIVAALLYKLAKEKKWSPEGNVATPCDIFNYILEKRPQAFTYGFRINFYSSFTRYINSTEFKSSLSE